MLYGVKREHLAGVQLYTVGVFTRLRSVKVSPCVHNSMTDKSAGITFHIGFSRGAVQALHFSLRQKKNGTPHILNGTSDVSNRSDTNETYPSY